MADMVNVRIVEKILKENGMLSMKDLTEMSGFCQETIFSCFKDIRTLYRNNKMKLVRYPFERRSYYFFAFVY